MRSRSETSVLVLRGHQATRWELRQWETLPDRFDVSYLLTHSNPWEVGDLSVRSIPARTLRDALPRGAAGDMAAGLAGDRYFHLERHLAQADIVHAEELSFWFAAQPAKLRRRAKFRLVMTVWETIPLMSAYRNPSARRNREVVLANTDLFLPVTERARDALVLEGVPEAKTIVCPAGIDLERFGATQDLPPPTEHVILSPGRLVWEKGHQDVLRAVAALHKGIIRVGDEIACPRVLIVGSGPEEKRLREHARELGIAEFVEFRPGVPYDEMPAIYARSSCMVLASLPLAAQVPLMLGSPRFFWEEQFGMVLAEAMAASLPIIASDSGAIREVLGETPAIRYFSPGDWMGVARALAEGPLSRRPGDRVAHDPERVKRYSVESAASRLEAAYDRLLA